MKTLLLFLISFCCSLPLFAETITNQELLKSCKGESTDTQNFCYGFIISAANAAQFYRNIVDTDGTYIDICFPDNVTNQEIVDLYITWAEKNTTTAGDSAFIGVSSSFSTKYSCPDKESDTKKVVLSPVSVSTPPKKPVAAPVPPKAPVVTPHPSLPLVAPHPALISVPTKDKK